MPKYVNNYSNGTVFCVPLKNGKYARGVVARSDEELGIFGYFFGPCLDSIPATLDESQLCIEETVLAGIFSGMGLCIGEWKQLGNIKSFQRKDWPMPMLINTEDESDRVELVEYDEDTLAEKLISVSTRGEVDIDAYPEDGVMGYKYVEDILTMKLDPSFQSQNG
ncbi:Imm26 family immunity protein [Gimesia algae]|uniref:Immunity protein 26 n=1 Tax=Gimesia algae TaxID=2527971 RepID=A0A517VCT6_9PLAN|nr:Imm26 family immunity protein [Gimesia algae]QDT90824.1 hypothetical protein Pan161_24780 [Gimesia algae]